MPINFFTEDINFNLPHKRKIKKWIADEIDKHNKTVGEISIVFCSEEKILEINTTYLNHNYFTDIITFPYIEGDEVSTDIYISIPTVNSNAKKYKQIFFQELLRVVIHGILHLVGYDDSTPICKEEMTKKEDECLRLFNTNYAKEV